MEKMEKVEHLIENGKRQLDVYDSVFNTIDNKTVWLFTVVSATLGYIIIQYFDKVYKEFSVYNTSHFIYSVNLFIAIYILYNCIYILQSKTFNTGPNIPEQKREFINNENKTYTELQLDTLKVICQSIEGNSGVLKLKAQLFKKSMYGLVCFYIGVFLFFLLK